MTHDTDPAAGLGGMIAATTVVDVTVNEELGATTVSGGAGFIAVDLLSAILSPAHTAAAGRRYRV